MSEWDEDIAELKLTVPEKDGLQMYRNYSRAFQQERRKQLFATLVSTSEELAAVQKILALVATEDVRFLPVVICSFLDELLGAMYERVLPDDTPGGKKDMISTFGPLGSFSNRIRFAHAFELLSKELLVEFDLLRRVRNDVAHRWDAVAVDAFARSSMQRLMTASMAVAFLAPLTMTAGEVDNHKAFRAALGTIAVRAAYEARAYKPVKDAGLDTTTLFAEPKAPVYENLLELLAEFRKRIDFGNA